jgi:PAS domain S-box-containing protein
MNVSRWLVNPCVILCSILFVPILGHAQNSSTDSLRHALTGAKDKQSRFAILTELSFQYRQNKPDSSLYFGLTAIELGNQLDDKGKLAATYNFIGLAHLYKGELSRALENYQSALNLAESAEDEIQIGHAHNNLGRLFLKVGDIEQSHKHFLLARTAFEKANDKPGLTYLYLGFSEWYEFNKNYDSAIIFSMKALALRRQMSDKGMLISAMIETGQLYERKKQFQQSSRFFKEAESVALKYNDPFLLAKIKIKSIEVMLATDSLVNIDESIQYANQFLSKDQIDLRAKLSLVQGKMAARKNDQAKAISFYKLIVDDVALRDFEVRDEAASLLVGAFYAKGDFKEAEKYRVKAKLEQGNKRNQSLLQELERINLKFELERQDKLNQELALANARKRTTLYAIVGVILVAGLVAAIVFGFRRKRNEDKEEHKTQEKILLQKLTDSERKNKKLVEESLLIICTHDMQGVLLSMNTPGARTIGFEPSEMVGKNIASLIPESGSDGFKQYMEEVKSTGTSSGFMKVMTKWGESRIFLYRNVLVNEENEPTYVMGSALDVTDWKNAEQEERRLRAKLDESEKLYRLISENSQDIIALFDKDGKHLFISPSTEKVLGYTTKEWSELPAFSAMHPDDVERLAVVSKGKFENGESIQGLRFRLKKKDGAYLWMEANYTPLLDENKKLYAVQSILRNITERMHTEEKLSESERSYRLLAENMSDLIMITDIEGNYKFISASVIDFLGYSQDELMGKNAYQFVYPEDIPYLKGGPSTQVSQGKNVSSILYRMVKKNGNLIWVEAYAKPLAHSEGETPLFQTVIHDITIRKSAEDKLADSEQLYRLLSENSNDLICLHTLDGSYQFVSSSVTQLLGYTPKELIGTDPYSIIHPDDHEFLRNQPHQQTIDGQSVQNISYRMRKKDGTYVWMEAYTQPIEENGKVTGFQTSSRDITVRKEYEDALSEAKEKAEQTSKYKSEFLSSMSHEIRTPLNAIIGLADILLKRNPREEQIKIFRMLKNSGDNLLTIVNDILDFSKVEAGKMELEETVFNLIETGKEVVQLFHEKAENKKIKLLFEADSDLPAMIMGDQGKIRQVLTNLVSNSIKFTSAGHVDMSIQLVNKEDKRYTILFSVSDTGIGIEADKLSLIFESFAQAGQDTARKYGGTGLGLAIVKRLINLMGSEIYVESEPGNGSRFFFTLLVEEPVAEKA